MSLGKNKSNSSQTFDPELKGMLTDTFQTGRQLAQTPYQPYDFATVAPLAPAELEGMNMTADTARAGVGQAEMNQAIGGAQAGMNFQPNQVSASGPVGVGNIASQGINAQQIGALPGIQAQNVGGQTVQAQSLANTNLDPYQNQYTTGVIDAALGDLDRARQMTQNQNAAAATSAGAFGGDRQALVEAETNRNFGDQAAKTAVGLRQQAFNNAQAAAQTDLNRAQDAGGQNAQSAMQAALANQQAGLSAGQQNMQAELARQQANQRASLSAAQDSAGRAQQASQQMAQMGLQSGLAGQDAALRAALANQQAGLAGAGQRLQSGQQLANFGGDLRGMQFSDAQALQGVGNQQRMAGQQLLDDRYRRFAEERDNPFRMFDVLRSGAGLLPNPLTSSSKGRSLNAGVS